MQSLMAQLRLGAAVAFGAQIGNRPLKQSCKAARGQPMALNGTWS